VVRSTIKKRHLCIITLHKSSAVAEMGDCLATIDMGRKLGAAVLCALFEGGGRQLSPRLTQCGLGRGVPPYQVTSWSIQSFGNNRHGLNTGGVGQNMRLLTNKSLQLESQIGSHMCCIEWCHCRWPWVTLNPHVIAMTLSVLGRFRTASLRTVSAVLCCSAEVSTH